MRLALARSFFYGKYVVIDSDLSSLDKVTRGKVMKGVREWVKDVQSNG